jgi:hypothetical protein
VVAVDGYRRKEAITAARQGLNVLRLFGIVCKRRADLIDAEIDATLEVYECVVTPEALPDFLACHGSSRVFCKQAEHFERLRMYLERDSGLAQLTVNSVQFKRSETNHRGSSSRRSHDSTEM